MGSKMISISIPEEMLPEIDAVARQERRSRSELIREALRRYIGRGRERYVPVEEPTPDEVEAIHRGEEAFAKGDFVRLTDLQNELGLPTK